MDDALCSILCNQRWDFLPGVRQFITFNRDGTGEVCPAMSLLIHDSFTNYSNKLYCVWDSCFMYLFAVNLDWKPLPLPISDHPTSNINEPSGQCLGTLRLEIALDKSVANSFTGPSPSLRGAASANEHYLSPLAFLPRIFTVSIYKGNFIAPRYIGWKGAHRRYNLLLVFDKSPYPDAETFAYPPHSYDLRDAKLEKETCCVARALPPWETTGWAMNEPAFADGDWLRPLRRLFGMEFEKHHICGHCTPSFGPGSDWKAIKKRQDACVYGWYGKLLYPELWESRVGLEDLKHEDFLRWKSTPLASSLDGQGYEKEIVKDERIPETGRPDEKWSLLSIESDTKEQ